MGFDHLSGWTVQHRIVGAGCDIDRNIPDRVHVAQDGRSARLALLVSSSYQWKASTTCLHHMECANPRMIRLKFGTYPCVCQEPNFVLLVLPVQPYSPLGASYAVIDTAMSLPVSCDGYGGLMPGTLKVDEDARSSRHRLCRGKWSEEPLFFCGVVRTFLALLNKLPMMRQRRDMHRASC